MAGGLPIRPRTIAIDTNIFLVLLSYHSLKSEVVSAADRERRLVEVRGRDDKVSLDQFDALWRIFARAERRIVTQHVVAEAFSNKMRRRSNWSSAIELLPKYDMEERGCCIRDLYAQAEFRRIVEEIGPTDAGLIYTAGTEKATIITEDRRLRQWAEVRSVPALALNQLECLQLR
jgi:rRNA-processing protein FCF1